MPFRAPSLRVSGRAGSLPTSCPVRLDHIRLWSRTRRDARATELQRTVHEALAFGGELLEIGHVQERQRSRIAPVPRPTGSGAAG